MFHKLFITAMSITLLIMTVVPLAAAPASWPEEAGPDLASLTGIFSMFSSEETSDFVPLHPQAPSFSTERTASPFAKMASFFASGEEEWLTVIIELPQMPLTVQYERNARLLSATDQKRYVTQLENVQAKIETQFAALDVEVIDRYQLIYNGFLARVPAHRIELLRDLPGVKAVHDMPLYYPALEHSVPLIKADEVINDLGYDGTGVTVGIIDTGIDYLHEAFAGSGSVADYQANDPTIATDYPITTPVIAGGWDFAGATYDGSNTPVPDPDPMDYDGHGTHVASTVAGQAISGTLGAGVAPGAKLYALKVFGDGGGGTATALYISALEWAMDPNQDNDVTDHLDVVNMSLGGEFGMDMGGAESVAVENAVKAGMVVVASAGNAGDTHFITDSPGTADAAISVAASSTGYEAGPVISFGEANYIYVPGALTDSPVFTEAITAELFDVATVQTQAPSLCSTTGFSGTELTDKIALVVFHLPNEAGCTGSQQVNNAASLGAKAVIMYHYSPGVRGRLTGDPAPIPVGMITVEAGMALMAAHGQAVTIHNQNEIRSVPGTAPADTIGSFSSRGPRVNDAILKPEITAPGVQIVAAAAGSGNGSVALDGTSMAAPHVAGVAALMRQAHPNWDPDMIKAAMMNTAVDLVDGSCVPRYGAGRVDARAAVEAETLVGATDYLISPKWGYVPFTGMQHSFTDTLGLYNEGAAKTFDIAWQFSTTQTLQSGLDVQLPVSVTVDAQSQATVEVTVTLDAQAIISESQALTQQSGGLLNILEEYHGFVTFTNQADASEVLRLPFYIVPRPYTQLTATEISTNTIGISDDSPLNSPLSFYVAYDQDPQDGQAGDPRLDINLVGMQHVVVTGTQVALMPVVTVWEKTTTLGELLLMFPDISLNMKLDVDEDGTPDYYLTAMSNAQFSGKPYPDDLWVVVATDASGSPLGPVGMVRMDYFAGAMEWLIVGPALGIDAVNNPDFTFQFVIYGGQTVIDESAIISYDTSQPDITYTPVPDESGMKIAGFTYELLSTNALGMLLRNAIGEPGNETLFIPLLNRIYLPLIMR